MPLKTLGQEVSEAITDLRQMSHSFQSSSEESSSHIQTKKKLKSERDLRVGRNSMLLHSNIVALLNVIRCLF